MRRSLARKTLQTALLCLGLGLAASGCVTSPVHIVKQTAGPPDCVGPAPDREFLVGLSVSGGGSRAALFAASRHVEGDATLLVDGYRDDFETVPIQEINNGRG